MWTNSPLAVLALEEQTDDSETPLRSRPQTFCVAVSMHELSEGRDISHAGPKAISNWDLTRRTGLSRISVYQLELPENDNKCQPMSEMI